MDQQQLEAGLAATSLATTTVVERKIGGWPCVVRVRSGDRGEPNSALRRWRDGRVPGRCGRVRARASRRNGPGRRVPGQAGHGCRRSRWPGRGCDALRGAAGRRGHRAPGHTGPAVWAPPNRPRFRRGLRAAALWPDATAGAAWAGSAASPLLARGLVVLAALAVAAPARAQDTTLVTNTSISTSAVTDTDSVEYAQGFRTGGNTDGK